MGALARRKVLGGLDLIGAGQRQLAVAVEVVVVDHRQGLAEGHPHILQVFRIHRPRQRHRNGGRQRFLSAHINGPDRYQFSQSVVFLHLAGNPQPHAGFADLAVGIDKQGLGRGGIIVGLVVGLLKIEAAKPAF